jgi:hypothetical protein
MDTTHRLPLIQTKFAADFPEWLPSRGSIIRRVGRSILALAAVSAAVVVFLMIVERAFS